MIRPPMPKSIASFSPSTMNLELSLGRGVLISCIYGKGMKNGSEVRVSILGGNGNGERMEKMLLFGYGRCLFWGVFGWRGSSGVGGGTSEGEALELGVKLVGLALI